MYSPLPGWRPALIAGLCVLVSPFASAGPPTDRKSGGEKRAPSPSPAQVLSASSADPLLRWLFEQNGDANSIVLPLDEVIRGASGKAISPIDPTSAADASIVGKIGRALDTALPKLNRPNSPAHAERPSQIDAIAGLFEAELSAALGVAEPVATDGSYPAFHVTDPATGKAYYIAVALYPDGKRDDITRTPARIRAFRFHPAEGGRRVTADGSCLLAGIEYSAEMTFLNWELIDVARLPVRGAVTFEAGTGVHAPGAVLTDGRNGRD